MPTMKWAKTSRGESEGEMLAGVGRDAGVGEAEAEAVIEVDEEALEVTEEVVTEEGVTEEALTLASVEVTRIVLVPTIPSVAVIVTPTEDEGPFPTVDPEPLSCSSTKKSINWSVSESARAWS